MRINRKRRKGPEAEEAIRQIELVRDYLNRKIREFQSV